jgi:hypothetical protein
VSSFWPVGLMRELVTPPPLSPARNRMSRGFQAFPRSVVTRYSINRFARGSSADGIVSPSAIAV